MMQLDPAQYLVVGGTVSVAMNWNCIVLTHAAGRIAAGHAASPSSGLRI